MQRIMLVLKFGRVSYAVSKTFKILPKLCLLLLTCKVFFSAKASMWLVKQRLFKKEPRIHESHDWFIVRPIKLWECPLNRINLTQARTGGAI